MADVSGYRELKDDSEMRSDAKKTLEPTSSAGRIRLSYQCPALNVDNQLPSSQGKLPQADGEEADKLHAVVICCHLLASDMPDMIVYGVISTFVILCLMACYMTTRPVPLPTLPKRGVCLLIKADAGMIASALLGGTLFVFFYCNARATMKWHIRYTQPRVARVLLQLEPRTYARPDLAIGSSEEGVVSQPKQSICSSVGTPIQPPQGRLPVSSSGGPDNADIDSTSTRASPNKPCWLLASSAPCHMAGDANQMTDYVPTEDNNIFVTVPNMGAMRVHGTGSVRTATVCLDGVKHVPGLGSKNLVSTGQLARGGYTVTLAPSGCRITARGNDHTVVVGEAHFTDESLFQVDFLRVPASSSSAE